MTAGVQQILMWLVVSLDFLVLSVHSMALAVGEGEENNFIMYYVFSRAQKELRSFVLLTSPSIYTSEYTPQHQ